MKWIPKILTLVLAAGLALAGCQAETTPDKNPAISAQSMDTFHTYARFVELYAQGRNWEALPFGKEAVRLGEQEFGPENPTVAKMIDSLGLLYASMGRYTEAEQHYLRALAIQEKAQGPLHPDVAHVLDLLANLYSVTGRYAEAEPLYQRSLAIWEKDPEPNHPEVAKGLESYARLLRKTGRAEEAAEMEARAKAIRAAHAEAQGEGPTQ